jgi:hypothetical protein
VTKPTCASAFGPPRENQSRPHRNRVSAGFIHSTPPRTPTDAERTTAERRWRPRRPRGGWCRCWPWRRRWRPCSSTARPSPRSPLLLMRHRIGLPLSVFHGNSTLSLLCCCCFRVWPVTDAASSITTTSGSPASASSRSAASAPPQVPSTLSSHLPPPRVRNVQFPTTLRVQSLYMASVSSVPDLLLHPSVSGGQSGAGQRHRRRGFPQLRAPPPAPRLRRRGYHARPHRRVSTSTHLSLSCLLCRYYCCPFISFCSLSNSRVDAPFPATRISTNLDEPNGRDSPPGQKRQPQVNDYPTRPPPLLSSAKNQHNKTHNAFRFQVG